MNILWYVDLNNYGFQLTCKAAGNVQIGIKKLDKTLCKRNINRP